MPDNTSKFSIHARNYKDVQVEWNTPAVEAYQSLAACIPFAFRCPLCDNARPSIYQWAKTCDGSKHGAVCRHCLSKHPELQLPPTLDTTAPLFNTPEDLDSLYYVAELTARDRITPYALNGRCIAGICFICGKNKTRRIEGYCNECRYDKLVIVHGDVGAYRIDCYARHFKVVSYLTPSSYHKVWAEYAWGLEVLPVRTSMAGTLEQFEWQRACMWELVSTHQRVAQRACARFHKGDPAEAEAAYSDTGMRALCKSVLSYDRCAEASADIEDYIVRSVRHALTKRANKRHAIEGKQQGLTTTLERTLVGKPATIYYSDDDEIDYSILDPAQKEFEALGLTEFERALLYDHYVDKVSLEVLGEKYGVVKGTIHGWIKKIRKRIIEQ